MQKLLLCACVLVIGVVMTSARPSDEEQILEVLLERLLEEKADKRAREECEDMDCHTGKCYCEEDCFCWKCDGKNKNETNGGLRCELPDPCGQKGGKNPCAGNEDKPRCKTSSFVPSGYYCLTSKRSFLEDLMDNLEEHADQEEYRQARLMLARSDSPGEGLAKAVRELLN